MGINRFSGAVSSGCGLDAREVVLVTFGASFSAGILVLSVMVDVCVEVHAGSTRSRKDALKFVVADYSALLPIGIEERKRSARNVLQNQLGF